MYKIKEELNISLDWLLTGKNEQDTTDPSAPFQIYKRIEDCLERKTNHKVWENDFDIFNDIEDIVHKQELSDWLYGRQNVNLSKVVKIANKLGESVQFLITGSYISKDEYTRKYIGSKETEDSDFYKQFSNLNPSNKETIKHMTGLLFNEQHNKQ